MVSLPWTNKYAIHSTEEILLPRFSIISEVSASEFLENLEEMFPRNDNNLMPV